MVYQIGPEQTRRAAGRAGCGV